MSILTTILNPCGPSQVVAYTGTAGTISNALPSGVNRVWVFCTTVAYVKIGVDPTATTADFPVPASVPVVLSIGNLPSGQAGNIKVSAIQSAAGGNLHVCPLAD